MQRFLYLWGDRQERLNFKRGTSTYIKYRMLKEGLGWIYLLAPKGNKGKDKCSYVLEQELGQQRRTDTVMHTLFSFELGFI